MRKIVSFLKEARAELGKVLWPTRRRTLRLTTIVVIVTILFGAFIGAVDYGLDQGLQGVLDATEAGGPQEQTVPVDPNSVQQIPAPVTTPK